MKTRTKLQKTLKGVLDCSKLQIAFKCHIRLLHSFCYKDVVPKDLTTSVNNKFQHGLYNKPYYSISVRKLDIRSGKHILSHL